VVQVASGGGFGIAGPITIYQFAKREPVAYTESNRGGRLAEDRTEVARRVDELGIIRMSALPPAASADMIRTIMEGCQ
jgi:hypothetical protein